LPTIESGTGRNLRGPEALAARIQPDQGRTSPRFNGAFWRWTTRASPTPRSKGPRLNFPQPGLLSRSALRGRGVMSGHFRVHGTIRRGKDHTAFQAGRRLFPPFLTAATAFFANRQAVPLSCNIMIGRWIGAVCRSQWNAPKSYAQGHRFRRPGVGKGCNELGCGGWRHE